MNGKGIIGQQLVKVLETGMSVWNKSGETSIRLHKFNLAGLRSRWTRHSDFTWILAQTRPKFSLIEVKASGGGVGAVDLIFSLGTEQVLCALL